MKPGRIIIFLMFFIFLFLFCSIKAFAYHLLSFEFRPWQNPTFQTYSISTNQPGTTTIYYYSSAAYLHDDGGYEFLGAQSSPVLSGSYTFNWDYSGNLGVNGGTQLIIFNWGTYPGGTYPQQEFIVVGAYRQYQFTNGPFHFYGQVTIPNLKAGDNIQVFLNDGPYNGYSMSGTLVLTQVSGPSLDGDINGDTLVNLTDAIYALKAACGISSIPLDTDADVNGDNKIGTQEAIYILEYVSGIRGE